MMMRLLLQRQILVVVSVITAGDKLECQLSVLIEAFTVDVCLFVFFIVIGFVSDHNRFDNGLLLQDHDLLMLVAHHLL